MAPRKEGVEVSIYQNPALFSRDAWRDCEDAEGYFKKMRKKLVPNSNLPSDGGIRTS
jgi:hypothetical protein